VSSSRLQEDLRRAAREASVRRGNAGIISNTVQPVGYINPDDLSWLDGKGPDEETEIRVLPMKKPIFKQPLSVAQRTAEDKVRLPNSFAACNSSQRRTSNVSCKNMGNPRPPPLYGAPRQPSQDTTSRVHHLPPRPGPCQRRSGRTPAGWARHSVGPRSGSSLTDHVVICLDLKSSTHCFSTAPRGRMTKLRQPSRTSMPSGSAPGLTVF